eukprot:CAMPEP_0172657770 /NCGR_PEP_ID=MMETSP1074-20121228/2319_1 /TAXON_ID=2916 /ORGANISM="Ceratium fusus, Strain PA161109" /LENGTH=62 /DNA_ID=CAMNT_0013472927 /DNA_START=12 /DNA_END=200 /DNA_ORIENTATION=+
MQSHTSDWTNEYGPGADAAKPSASQPKLLGFRSDARQNKYGDTFMLTILLIPALNMAVAPLA